MIIKVGEVAEKERRKNERHDAEFERERQVHLVAILEYRRSRYQREHENRTRDRCPILLKGKETCCDEYRRTHRIVGRKRPAIAMRFKNGPYIHGWMLARAVLSTQSSVPIPPVVAVGVRVVAVYVLVIRIVAVLIVGVAGRVGIVAAACLTGRQAPVHLLLLLLLLLRVRVGVRIGVVVVR